MLIHTVLREKESLHMDVKNGITLNDCEVSVERSDAPTHNAFLFLSWQKHFDKFRETDQIFFVGMQNDLIMEKDTIKYLIAGLNEYDLAMYSTAGGSYPDINDALFACTRAVIEAVPFISKQICPLCAWITRARSYGFNVGFVCDNILGTIKKGKDMENVEEKKTEISVVIPDKSSESILRMVVDIEKGKKAVAEFIRATLIALGHDIDKKELTFDPRTKTVIIK